MISGNGSTIRRAPTAPTFRIRTVQQTARLNLQQTKITGGAAVQIARVYSSGAGGGLLNSGGFVALTNCPVSANRAHRGGGVYNRGNGDADLQRQLGQGKAPGGLSIREGNN
jgi:hypothetical protein